MSHYSLPAKTFYLRHTNTTNVYTCNVFGTTHTGGREQLAAIAWKAAGEQNLRATFSDLAQNGRPIC